MRPLSRLLAVAGLVAAGTVALPGSAGAAACAEGVTVVVDFNQLGGGVQQACVPGQGSADDLFRAAGHTLQDVQQQPGFVCRVDNLPSEQDEACVRTPPANRYWGLWWSNGSTGTWSYSQEGAYSLQVPKGGSVGFSWNNSSTRSQPSATPPDQDGSGGSGGSGGGAGSGTGSGSGSGSGSAGGSTAPATPSAPPTAGSGGSAAGRDDGGDGRARQQRGRAAREARAERQRDREVAGKQAERREKRAQREQAGEAPDSASPTPDDEVVTSDPTPVADEGLPVWVPVSVVTALFAVAAVAAYLRRRSSA